MNTIYQLSKTVECDNKELQAEIQKQEGHIRKELLPNSNNAEIKTHIVNQDLVCILHNIRKADLGEVKRWFTPTRYDLRMILPEIVTPEESLEIVCPAECTIHILAAVFQTSAKDIQYHKETGQIRITRYADLDKYLEEYNRKTA